jgi:Icc-related predicted phosphoesterase
VKILFTADLHLVRATQERTLLKVQEWITRHRPDALVVAGDLSSAQQAGDTLKSLRGCFPQGPIAVCLGNHDFWVLDDSRKEVASLAEVIDRYWAPAAKSVDVVLLDQRNLLLQGLTVVGGYGHYDLGFAVPGLAYDGVRVVEDDYLRGAPSTNSVLRWRDFQFMPSGGDLREIAREQVEGVRRRLSESVNSGTIVVLHTPPLELLLGVPPLSALRPDSSPSPYAFFRAYLGNRSMGVLLQEFRDGLVGVVCGHTHRATGPMDLGGSIGINIGSDYGVPRAALFCAESGQFERVGEG